MFSMNFPPHERNAPRFRLRETRRSCCVACGSSGASPARASALLRQLSRRPAAAPQICRKWWQNSNQFGAVGLKTTDNECFFFNASRVLLVNGEASGCSYGGCWSAWTKRQTGANRSESALFTISISDSASFLLIQISNVFCTVCSDNDI